MPLLALRGIIVFPGMTVNLDVGRDKSINAVNAAMQLDKKILLVTQRDAETADPKREDLYGFGVVAEIKQLLKLPSGALRILIQGLNRVEVTSVIDAPFKDVYLEGFVQPFESIEPEENAETEAMRRILLQSFEKWLITGKKVTTEVMLNFKNITTARKNCWSWPTLRSACTGCMPFCAKSRKLPNLKRISRRKCANK